MKKNLALVLALVMIIGSLLSLVPMAEDAGTTPPPAADAPVAKYVPEVAYSNLNYSDKMYVMFAVPAPAALGEGEAVKLVLWDSIDDVKSFSYNDENKIVIDAEAEKAKIGEVDHLVFKYDALTAADMTQVIYVRPVVVAADKAISYGPVVEYSVLEYVAAAKGEFEGIEGLKDQETIKLLDSMLTFGSLAQKYLLEKPPVFYANEDLNKVFVTPVFRTDAKDKIFAGFFKYVADEQITIVFPHYDGYEVVSVLDKSGAAVVDANDKEPGFQVVATEADLELTANYKNITLTTLVAENYGDDFNFNTVDGYKGTSSDFTAGSGTGNGDKALYNGDMKLNGKKQITWNNSSASFTNGSEKPDGSSKNYRRYHGFKTVADPENEGQLVFQWTASDYGAFTHSQFTEANLRAAGMDDTVGAVITFEMELGGHNGKVANIGTLYHRLRLPKNKYYLKDAAGNYVDAKGNIVSAENKVLGASNLDIDTFICRVYDGKFQIVTGDKQYADVGEVPVDGMRKFAVTVDYDAEMVYGYAEDENGVMQLLASAPLYCPKYAANKDKYGFESMKNLILPSSLTDVLSFNNSWTFTGSSNWGDGNNALVDLDGDGVATDKVMDGYVDNPTSYWALVGDKLVQYKNDNGPRMSPNYNLQAVQMYAEANCGILIDNYYLVVGNPYN